MKLDLMLSHQMTVSALENRKSTQTTTRDGLERNNRTREQLRANAHEAREEAIELIDDMAEARGRGGWDKFCSWIKGENVEGAIQERQLENQVALQATEQKQKLLGEVTKELVGELKVADRMVEHAIGAQAELIEQRTKTLSAGQVGW